MPNIYYTIILHLKKQRLKLFTLIMFCVIKFYYNKKTVKHQYSIKSVLFSVFFR